MKKDLVSQRLGNWGFPLKTGRGKGKFCAPQGCRGHLCTQVKDLDGKVLRFCAHTDLWNTGTCVQVGLGGQKLAPSAPFCRVARTGMAAQVQTLSQSTGTTKPCWYSGRDPAVPKS